MNKTQEIATRLREDVSIIDIRGEVTALSGQRIEEAYHGISAAAAKKILMVFATDCYINSGGIAVLIGILGESRKKAETVRMCGLTPHFQKIFSMVGLTKSAQIYPSEEAAIKDF